MLENKQKLKDKRVGVIGVGLAGSEAIHFLANKGVKVFAFESKRIQLNPAQKDKNYGELVCTNSLKSKDENSAHGILKQEMKAMGSIVLDVAEKFAVPAGGALAVDREKFSEALTHKLEALDNTEFIHTQVADPLSLKEEYSLDYVIIATGPLTFKGLEEWISTKLGDDDLYFYDAIAPVVDADSLDLSKMYFKDRYEEFSEQADYLNIPLDKEQYEEFVKKLVEANKVPAQNFEEMKFFEACLPIDIMAERGAETLRFSCMKPVGLENEEGKRAYAVVQLRKENLLGSAFNIVGFQNRLTYSEQVRIFNSLPGLERAKFIKLGSVHRNTFINAKTLLRDDLSSHKYPWLSFAGQITGVEGYTESASMGLLAAYQIYRKLLGQEPVDFPKEMAMGALINYIKTVPKPTPSNINFGLFPEIEVPKVRKMKRGDRKKFKKELVAKRASEYRSSFFNELSQ